ncbi:uncharacterized protein [Dermacentor albipictus]|uniref:uncharacterized protein n=1 Tax=Dermacentor albipictus TaxID=60249 RepID=UPI0038FCAD3B
MAAKTHLSIFHESTNERLGHRPPEMYESYMHTIICGIMMIFSVVCVIVIAYIAVSHQKHKSPLLKNREVTGNVTNPPSEMAARQALQSRRHPACSQPMYFRCLNGSDYDRGEWIFVQRERDSPQPGQGSCRRWQPEKVCTRDSPAHFRKRRDCVQTCELRRDKRCLTLVTERFLRPCSSSSKDNPRRFWYYDRVQRACARWAPAILCAYNAFRSVGHCKILCLVPHHGD